MIFFCFQKKFKSGHAQVWFSRLYFDFLWSLLVERKASSTIEQQKCKGSKNVIDFLFSSEFYFQISQGNKNWYSFDLLIVFSNLVTLIEKVPIVIFAWILKSYKAIYFFLWNLKVEDFSKKEVSILFVSLAAGWLFSNSLLTLFIFFICLRILLNSVMVDGFLKLCFVLIIIVW